MVKNADMAMRQLILDRQIFVGLTLMPPSVASVTLNFLRCFTVEDQSEMLLAEDRPIGNP